MTTPFKNILLIGATGSIGRYVLAALLAKPSLSVTVLRRASSTAPNDLPANVRTITVPDDYPTDAVIAAFRGQDAVISCLTTLSVAAQFRLIDAAVTAGVRRYVPSEYGLNNMRADAQALSGVFRDKGAVQAYLRAKADKGEIEWMSVSCGMWIKWSMRNNFLGMRIKERAFERWDGGVGRFSVTTEENTALAVARALVEIPEDTKNRNVLVSEFVTTQAELLAEIERQLRQKLNVAEVDGRKRIAELKEAEAGGDGTAAYGLIEAGFVTGRYGSDLEKEGELFTDKLGLKRHSLEEVVADALASVQ
ncbi:hypothetical protein VTI74DRAFT_9478 [Chaetomium olivicolor]